MQRPETGDSQRPETDPEIGDEDDNYYPAPVPFPLIVILEGALAPVALILGAFLDQHPLSEFSWTRDALSHGALATLPMLAVLWITIRWPYGPFRRIKEFFDYELRPALADARWHDLALLSLAAGLGEEMLFRGVIQGAAVDWFGPVGGVVAASVLFGLLHPVSPAYVVLASLLGAFLGTILLREGNLLTVVIAHSLYDFIALIILLRPRADEANKADERLRIDG
ncbi:MAG: lysostaphin resistance A-like protein [Isosphaeraceae bacterium]